MPVASERRHDRISPALFDLVAPPRGGAFHFVIANWDPVRRSVRKLCHEYSAIAWHLAMDVYLRRQSLSVDKASEFVRGRPYGAVASRLLGLDEGKLARPLRELLPHCRNSESQWAFGGFEIHFNEGGRGITARNHHANPRWLDNPLHDAFWAHLVDAQWTPRSGGEIQYERGAEIVRLPVGYGMLDAASQMMKMPRGD